MTFNPDKEVNNMANEKILVVDDDNLTRYIIVRYLRQKGYNVLEARDGQSASELVKNEKFDVLIVDLIMPKMSGIDFITKVRESDLEAEIIALSATDKIDDVIQVMRDGKVYDFLRKSATDLEYLDVVISKALERRRLIKENRQLLEKLVELSIRDPLTDLYNRRKFEAQLDFEVKCYKRYKRPLCLMMLDVDHFKNYNDKNGHLKGDEVLKGTANLIQKHIREIDWSFRYGGEEFVVLLPATSKAKSYPVAERIRKAIFEEYFPGEEIQPLGRVTISIGIASIPDDASDALELIQKADEALYKAKSEGRNRVCIYQ
jgi:diguanylate cyclase (GGDEF)-like protein